MNTRVLSAGVWGVVLCLSATGTATDTTAGAVAPPDEAVECHALLRLCQPAEAALRKLQEVVRKRDRSEHLPPQSRTPASLAAFSKLQTQEKAARNEFTTRLLETLAATTALRVQHEQMPPCVRQCPHVLRPDLKVWE